MNHRANQQFEPDKRLNILKEANGAKMTLSNMTKKWLLFLIPLIATGTLGVLYSIFEVRILQLLSTWPQDTLPQNMLRISLGITSLTILVLSYWILELKSQRNGNEVAQSSQPKSSPPPKSKTKDIPIDDLIWTATNHPVTGLYVYDIPRCKVHDLALTYDGKTHHCPKQITGKCDIKLSASDLARLKRIATSYIDKQFRDEPPPPAPPTRPRRNWVTGWKKY